MVDSPNELDLNGVSTLELAKLRVRLWLALCCTPVLAASGCTNGGTESASNSKTKSTQTQDAKDSGAKPTTSSGPPEDFDRLPTCPNGNWCGTEALVEPLRPKPNSDGSSPSSTPDFEGCPGQFHGVDDPKLSGDAYTDLPMHSAVHATLDLPATKAKRDAGQIDACCYAWMESCGGGRPLLDEGQPQLARLARGQSWTAALPELNRAAIARLPSHQRQALAAAWLRDAQMEHSSIASFERAARELAAVDAPSGLLRGCERAAVDERRHARVGFGLAAAYAGSSLEPCSLASLAVRPGGLVRVAIDTFIEGCVGETVAAACMRRAANEAYDPLLVRLLERIADDEGDHAALAWQTLGWTIEQGGPTVRSALRTVADQLRPVLGEAVSATDDAPEPTGSRRPTSALLPGHGQLDRQTQARLRSDAWSMIIDPLLAELLTRPEA